MQFTDIILLDSVIKDVELRASKIVKNAFVGDIKIECIWRHIRMIDDDNQEWYTLDQGNTWHNGLKEFNALGCQGLPSVKEASIRFL